MMKNVRSTSNLMFQLPGEVATHTAQPRASCEFPGRRRSTKLHRRSRKRKRY